MIRKLAGTGLVVDLLIGCAPHASRALAPSSTKEAADEHSAPSLMGLTALRYEEIAAGDAKQGALGTKPWADSYWPYYKKDLAWRYQSDHDFDAVDDQVADAKEHPDDPALSPAEKYDLAFGGDAFGVTRDAWATYSRYKQEFGDDTSKWDWMGICNGWAPAALAEKAPAHAVVVPQGDKEIVFFEGDLRGLLSKAYDLDAPSQGYHVVGSRCDEASAKVARDPHGRPVDGIETDSAESFAILKDESLTLGAIEVTDDAVAPRPRWLVAKAPIAFLDGKMDLYVYDSHDAVAADVQDGTVGARAREPDPRHYELFKGCRDVNPASVHLALVERLSNAAAAPLKTSFVADVERFEQIWNHPLWGFVSEVGLPQPVADEPADRRAFRAPGASFSVPVTSRIVYVTEVEPAIAYQSDANETLDFDKVRNNDATYNMRDLKYTLEFDSGGFLIGGEWDERPNVDIEALAFFWQVDGPLTDLRPDGTPSPLKYSLLKKLLDCSQREPDTTVHVAGGERHAALEAVRCP